MTLKFNRIIKLRVLISGLKALEYLKEKGVFKGAASTQGDCLLKSLRSERESGKSK